MALQKTIIKVQGYDSTGAVVGRTAGLATGIPGERCDMTPVAILPHLTTAATKYGYIVDNGLVVNPKEGVRYARDIADSLDIAAGTNVSLATMGHFFVEVIVPSMQAIAKGATLEADSTNGGALTLSATSGTAGSGKTIRAKVLQPVVYAAASGTAGSAGYVPEKGRENFKAVSGGYSVIVRAELVPVV